MLGHISAAMNLDAYTDLLDRDWSRSRWFSIRHKLHKLCSFRAVLTRQKPFDWPKIRVVPGKEGLRRGAPQGLDLECARELAMTAVIGGIKRNAVHCKLT